MLLYIYIYIYIFSASASSYENVFLTIATPTDVLHITGLKHGKVASGIKLTIIIWMIFDIHTFVLSHLKSCIMFIYIRNKILSYMVALYSRPNGKHAKLQRCRSMHHVLVKVRHEPMLGRKHDIPK